MHQLNEVDILSAKMDLLMKKLKDQANEKKEGMHIHHSRMPLAPATCSTLL